VRGLGGYLRRCRRAQSADRSAGCRAELSRYVSSAYNASSTARRTSVPSLSAGPGCHIHQSEHRVAVGSLLRLILGSDAVPVAKSGSTPRTTPTRRNRTYNYVARLSVSDVGEQVSDFATTGRIQRPLVTLAGTMTACYRSITTPALRPQSAGPEDDDSSPPYRLWK